MYTVTSLMNVRHLSICSVCGDKASGKHYGVMSCDGCRGFFKRSIRRQIQYKCKADSTCQVDVNRRNQCQACRFQRCLAMKMKPSAVQNERAPSHGTKRVLPPCWTPPTFVGYRNGPSQVTKPLGFGNPPMTNLPFPIWSRMLIEKQPQQSFNASLDSNQQTLSDVSNADETNTSLDVNNNEMICETASFVLLESIRWLYLVPSFKEFKEFDQIFLIEQSWSLLFLFTSAEMKKFVSEDEMNAAGADDDDQYTLFQTMIKEIISHSIDPTEYTLLKLFVVFNTPMNDNHPSLHDRYSIDKYRKDALFMLTEYTRNSKYRRLAQLLMLLSHIQETISRISLEKLFFGQLIPRISMPNLLQNISRHLSPTRR